MLLTKYQPFCSGLNIINLFDFMMNYQLKFIELHDEVSLELIEIIEANECVVYDDRFQKYWLRLPEGYQWHTIWGNMGATQIWNTEISFSSVVMSWKSCEIRPSLAPVYMWESWRFIEKILSSAVTKLLDDLFEIFFFSDQRNVLHSLLSLASFLLTLKVVKWCSSIQLSELFFTHVDSWSVFFQKKREITLMMMILKRMMM